MIGCDFCEKQLNDARGITQYRIKLSCETVPDAGGVSIDVYIFPPIDRDHYFCGLGCLSRWLNKNE